MVKKNQNQLRSVLPSNDDADVLNEQTINNNLLFLQIKGTNQLFKEIVET